MRVLLRWMDLPHLCCTVMPSGKMGVSECAQMLVASYPCYLPTHLGMMGKGLKSREVEGR